MQQKILSVLETVRYQMVKVTLNHGLIKAAKRHEEFHLVKKIHNKFKSDKTKASPRAKNKEYKTTLCRCNKDHKANSSQKLKKKYPQ